MSWLIKLYSKDGHLEYKHRYYGFSKQVAIRLFRRQYDLVGKRLADRLEVIPISYTF